MYFNPEIFRAYDIRGVYGQDFDEDFAFQLGAAVVRYLRASKLIVGHDDRPASPALAGALIRGINSAGCDAVVLGMASFPFFYYSINESGADGGVMVTASHNDFRYNGFKLYRSGATPLDSESGLAGLKKILTDGNFEASKYAGKKISRGDLPKKYLAFISEKSGLEPGEIKISVSIDADGTVRKELEHILQKLKIRIVDKGDVGFEFDTDGDRVYVFGAAGDRIRGDLVVGVLAGHLKGGLFSRPKLVHDLRFSRGVLEKLSAAGIKLVRSRVGHTFIQKTMEKHGADLGGELSGHVYLREAKNSGDATLAMLKLLKIINASGASVEESVKPFETWANSGEISMAFSGQRPAFSEILEKIKEKYHDGKIDELDGITVESPDWWFNVRPSNTEPLLRLVVEARTKNLLDEKVLELKAAFPDLH